MQRYSSDDLGHLFVNEDQPMPNDYMDLDSDDTAQDANIMKKQRADWGSEIDRDAAGVGAPIDTDASHNPAQDTDTEYKRAVKAVVITAKDATTLNGAVVRLATSDPRTQSHPALTGEVLASNDSSFSVYWQDGSVTVEDKANYVLRRR